MEGLPAYGGLARRPYGGFDPKFMEDLTPNSLEPKFT